MRCEQVRSACPPSTTEQSAAAHGCHKALDVLCCCCCCAAGDEMCAPSHVRMPWSQLSGLMLVKAAAGRLWGCRRAVLGRN